MKHELARCRPPSARAGAAAGCGVILGGPWLLWTAPRSHLFPVLAQLVKLQRGLGHKLDDGEAI